MWTTGQVRFWLAVTFLFGLGFMGMEIYEFQALILEGYGPDRSAFLSSFFSLVGTHGLHVAFGLVWILSDHSGRNQGPHRDHPVADHVPEYVLALPGYRLGCVFTIVYLMGAL